MGSLLHIRALRYIPEVPVRQPSPERLKERVLLGERLHTLRRRAKLTQEAAAAKVGCTRETMRAWEEGRGEPQLLDARRLAQLYGVGIAVVALEADDQDAEPPAGAAQIGERPPGPSTEGT